MSNGRRLPAQDGRKLRLVKLVLLGLSLLPPTLLVASLIGSHGKAAGAPDGSVRTHDAAAAPREAAPKATSAGDEKKDEKNTEIEPAPGTPLPKRLEPKRADLKLPGTVRNLHRTDVHGTAP